MLELMVAHVGENIQTNNEITMWKFILAEIDGKIKFFAGCPFESGKLPHHGDIAKDNGVPRAAVLGGGRMDYMEGKLKLHDYSVEFGPVPNKVLRELEPLVREKLSSRHPVSEFHVGMNYDFAGNHPTQHRRWLELGYPYD